MYQKEEYQRLSQLIRETDAKNQKAKLKRNLLVVLLFSIVYFFILKYLEEPEGLELLGTALVSLVLGGIHFFVNLLIFLPLINKSNSENAYLENLKKQLADLS